MIFIPPSPTFRKEVGHFFKNGGSCQGNFLAFLAKKNPLFRRDSCLTWLASIGQVADIL